MEKKKNWKKNGGRKTEKIFNKKIRTGRSKTPTKKISTRKIPMQQSAFLTDI